jgi:hypothetical protein
MIDHLTIVELADGAHQAAAKGCSCTRPPTTLAIDP